MGSEEICWMSAIELLEAYRKRDLSPVEVTRSLLGRIEEMNPKINAIITVTEPLAMELARRSEKAYKLGNPGKLEGVPVTIKDLVATRGIRTTLGSLMFEDYVPKVDAVLVERLRGEGAVLLGKTNVPEFGLVAVTDNLVFGPSRNPWNTDRTTGGSSGGAAAALAAGLGPLASGNDGGGSIRIPSSLCGVFGLKPHFGRVPSYPHIVPGWETMNAEGPMARKVADAALMLDVMAGPDERDRFSLPASDTCYLDSLQGGVEGLRLAYTADLATAAIDPEIEEITRKAAFSFEDLGCEVVLDQPEVFDMSEDLTKLVIAEVAAAHEPRMEEAKTKLYPSYRPFLDLKDLFSAVDLAKVGFRREELWSGIWPFFEEYDLLLTPSTACAAFDIKEGMLGPEEIDGREVSPASWISFTFPFNFTGQPAASILCGFNREGLPVGLQLVGRRFDELTVLRAASAYEAASKWSDMHPED